MVQARCMGLVVVLKGPVCVCSLVGCWALLPTLRHITP